MEYGVVRLLEKVVKEGQIRGLWRQADLLSNSSYAETLTAALQKNE